MATRTASTVPSPPHPGRPRDLRARRAVLDAARQLIEKGGYPAATIDAIAARSGVAKTTIYRWWPNRPALALDLLVEMATAVAPPPAGTDPLRALHTELRLVAQALDALPGQLLISLLGEAQDDPDIHDALMRQLFAPRRSATAHVIRRAQTEGVLRRDVPPLLAVDLLYGPLFYRKVIRHEAVAGAYVRQMFQHVLGELLAPPGRRRK